MDILRELGDKLNDLTWYFSLDKYEENLVEDLTMKEKNCYKDGAGFVLNTLKIWIQDMKYEILESNYNWRDKQDYKGNRRKV